MDGFEALHRTGMRAQHLNEWQAALDPNPDPDPEIDPILTFRSYDVTGSKACRDTILWHAVAWEMPIYPSSGVVTFLIDPDANTLLHVYDDRGMDLISDVPSRLYVIYMRFGDWLLDYDRDRMAELF